MDKLNIVAHGHRNLAMPGNKDMVAIAACVTKEDGSPVTGLTKADFKVRGLLTGNVHISTSISLFLDYQDSDSTLAGYYALFVKTTDNNIWVGGQYVFAVTVKSTSLKLQGRTIAVLEILKPADI
jgi:hypothetical protein